MDEKCSYCSDPANAVTIFRKTAGEHHKVQAIMDASEDEASVTFAVVRLPGSRTGRMRQYFVGFNINYCPMCGRKLRREDTIIK